MADPQAPPEVDYRVDPAAFVDKFLGYNELGRPWRLSAYQRDVLALSLSFDNQGDLRERLLLWSEVKKSGKTFMAACLALWWGMTRGPSEVKCLANDLDQSQGRVFATVAALCRTNGFEKAKLARLFATEVRLRNGSVIQAVASDYRGEAGGRQTLSIFDELWAVSSERAQRLWEEHQPIPTEKEGWVLVVTTAGFSGESTLLESLYRRGLAGERADAALEVYRDRESVMFWSHTPRQPWQTEAYYQQQARVLRPSTFARLHRNEWVTSESTFITAELFDGCVDAALAPLDTFDGVIFVGVDGGLTSDNLAVQAVAWDRGRLRLVTGRVWVPTPGVALDLESTVERYLRELHERFNVARILLDPWQLVRSMATLRADGLAIEAFAQTEQHTGDMGSTLWSLLRSQTLALYPDDQLRSHALAARAVENSRGGFRLAKQTSSRKIDAVVALSMACVAAVAAGPTASLRFVHGHAEDEVGEDEGGADDAGLPMPLSPLATLTGFARTVQTSVARAARRPVAAAERATEVVAANTAAAVQTTVEDVAQAAATVRSAAHRARVAFEAYGDDPSDAALREWQRLQSAAGIERAVRRSGWWRP